MKLFLFFLSTIILCTGNIAHAMKLAAACSTIDYRAQQKLNEDLCYNASHNAGALSQLIETGAQVNAYVDGRTALHCAAASGSLAIGAMQVLLQAGANPYAVDIHGDSSLCTAIAYGNYDGVRMMLASGFNPHARDESGHTPLDYFMQRARVKNLENYSTAGVERENQRLRNLTLRALLTTVSPYELQHVPFIILCLMKPITVSLTNGEEKELPDELRRRIAQLLVPTIIDEKLALAKEYLPDLPTDKLRALLTVSARNAFKRKMPTLPKLPAQDIMVVLSDEDKKHITDLPYFVLFHYKNQIVLQALLKAGADPNQITLRGETALFFEVSKGSLSSLATIKMLLDAGADVNARTIGGNTALHRAVWLGVNQLCPAIQLLIEAGGDTTIANASGVTPSQLAINAALLLEKKVNENIIRILITTVSPYDIEEVIPHIIALRKNGRYPLNAAEIIADSLIPHIIAQKLELVRAYLPNTPQEFIRFRPEILASINRLIRTCPAIKAAERQHNN
ncbi:MAG: ankyrin repeat domain-containing protein [Candidatus Babeliales bacterium]